MSFGNKLRQYRKEHKLEQKELAKILGVSKQTISAYETRDNRPTYNVFIKICNLLKVDAHYFMQDELEYIDTNIPMQEQEILSAYKKLSVSDKRVVDFILGLEEYKTSTVTEFPTNTITLPVCKQKASAGIGKIEDKSNPEITLMCFEPSIIPRGATHGIVIEGHSMEDKFFNNQIVFIEEGVECAPSDYGIFSVTDYECTKIYCKQLMQRRDGSKYLHSVNKEERDPDIDYKNVIDIHCVGKILL